MVTDSADATADDTSRRRFLARTGVAAAATAASLALAGPVPQGWALIGRGDRRDRPEEFDATVATAWFDLSRALVRTTPGFSPPVASRAFAYSGIALYEAVVPGSRRFRSLRRSLPGSLRIRHDTGHDLHWPTVANAALASMARRLFPTTSDANKAAIDALEESLLDRFGDRRSGDRRPADRRSGDRRSGDRVKRSTLDRSVDRGRSVARAVFDWSRDDGGHEGYLRNVDPDYVPPAGPGLWVPTPPTFQPALQPSWGDNRCFAISTGAACPSAPPTAYSEDPSSRFFAEAREVYDAVNGRTPEQEAIARFWSDDPGVTATPAGHSISIATQVLRRERASLMDAAEAYAKLGMALADAFVACWNAKYRYNLVRPVTYIRSVIDSDWLPMLTTPPFPEHTSGHSVQSGAAFQVLADLFGDRYSFDDHTHDDRGLGPRHFDAFSECADEAAISRLYGGIHFRPAIEAGLAQGRCVGRAVGELPFRRRH
jgi:PAP2 superfamily